MLFSVKEAAAAAVAAAVAAEATEVVIGWHVQVNIYKQIKCLLSFMT
jgi:hypothetical protein